MQCAAYKLLDRINRSWFQTLFYTNYKGRHASFKRPFAEFVHREYLRPRVRPQAREEVARLKREGYIVVLVTGSLDFLVRPLAMALGADVLIGARLEEDVHAVLTGRLDGEPVSDEEKAVRMHAFATHMLRASQTMATRAFVQGTSSAFTRCPSIQMRVGLLPVAWTLTEMVGQ